MIRSLYGNSPSVTETQMQLSKRVIQLAKERAIFGFAMLAQNIVADAQDGIKQAMAKARSNEEHRTLNSAMQFLHFDGSRFNERIQSFYRDYLDRAMQTMYTDLRTGLHNMSAEHLALIDDETINRQIEVDRLVLRMRDVDSENLGRLNIVIAQLHGDHDVRERENPFRPYLLARSLHEVLSSMVKDESESKILFDALSNALINRLPGFYASIREVFEANGVHSRLLARPAGMSHGQRVLLARQAAHSELALQSAALGGAEEAGQRIFSDLKRLQEKVEPAAAATAADGDGRPSAFQDFVRQMFNQQKPGETAGLRATKGDGIGNLIAALNEFQKAAAEGPGTGDEQSQALRARIESAALDDADRIMVDVVFLLFEFIMQDETVPAGVRADIGRLQIPFLKAVLLTPELLQQQQHPARQFLNRLGTLAAAIDPQQALDRRIAAAIAEAVDRVLDRFEQDMGAFTRATGELGQALGDVFRDERQVPMQACVDAVEDAEKLSVVLVNTTSTLNDLLPVLNPDPRVTGFITQVWVRVLARLFCHDIIRQDTGDAGDAAARTQLRKVLPELIWSAQPKQTPQERAALMRLLPDLAKRLQAGLALIGLPAAEAKRALDQLVDIHMQVLRGGGVKPAQPSMSLEELYQHFALLSVCEGSQLWTEDEPLKVESAVVRAAVAEHAAAVRLFASDDPIPAMASDAEWLGQMHLGLGVDVLLNGEYAPARLEAISSQRALFVFVPKADADPLMYSSVSLLKALRDGSMRMLEYAPLFDRAVESLLINAEAMPATR